jgi:hypothetical protein
MKLLENVSQKYHNHFCVIMEIVPRGKCDPETILAQKPNSNMSHVRVCEKPFGQK